MIWRDWRECLQDAARLSSVRSGPVEDLRACGRKLCLSIAASRGYPNAMSHAGKFTGQELTVGLSSTHSEVIVDEEDAHQFVQASMV